MRVNHTSDMSTEIKEATKKKETTYIIHTLMRTNCSDQHYLYLSGTIDNNRIAVKEDRGQVKKENRIGPSLRR